MNWVYMIVQFHIFFVSSEKNTNRYTYRLLKQNKVAANRSLAAAKLGSFVLRLLENICIRIHFHV